MAGRDSGDEPVALQGIRFVPNELRAPIEFRLAVTQVAIKSRNDFRKQRSDGTEWPGSLLLAEI